LSDNKWKCPKCGDEEGLQGIGGFSLKPLNDGSGLSIIIPKRIWCMKCQKEYPYEQCTREKVQFT